MRSNDLKQLESDIKQLESDINAFKLAKMELMNPSKQILSMPIASEKISKRDSSSLPPHQVTPSLGPSEKDPQLYKILIQNIPQISNWPTFSGRSNENFYDFIEYVDSIVQSIDPPDQLITCKFPMLFTGVALHWHNDLVRIHGLQPWRFWKENIIKQFGNHAWKTKMQLSFEKDRFNLESRNPSAWVSRQSLQ